jgi:serine/threonine-protein kinase
VQTSAVDPLVGRTLEGRYRLLERIARGGMSTVYAAVDERLDRQVAVKVMSSALSVDPKFSDRFAREARAAARLAHLNTVSVYDQGQEVGPDGHHVFLVMELVEGRTLRELLREKQHLAPAEAVSIMEPVLSALAAAHRAGLVHRDVKPENILLSDDGVVKVADFGLARAVESDAASTRTGLMMGTVAYCAPEQIAKGQADQRSDVYSAGIVFFELLTGQPPYKGETAMNVAYQHVHSRVPAPSSRVRGIPSEIDELVVMATDSDPAARPADAGAFLAELADVRTTLELPVVPLPVRPRRARSVPRAAVGASTDRATTDVIRGGVVAHSTAVVPRPGSVGGRALMDPEDAPPPPVVTPPPKRPRRTLTRQQRRRRRAFLVVVLLLLAGLGVGYGTWYLLAGRYAKVPNVAGESVAQARADLQHAGYHVAGSVFSDYNDANCQIGVQKGLVLRTDPAAGTRLVKGRTVKLTRSAGPHLYTVPSGLTGRTQDQARAALRSAGRFKVAPDVKPEHSDTVPSNMVTRTVPAAGKQVTCADTVTIYVSTGPPVIAIPAIAPGTPVADATKTLKRAGFKVQVADGVFNDTLPKNTVVSISPSGSARKFSVVTITPSKGPEFVTVPKIKRGTSTADAEAALSAVGLTWVIDDSFDGGVLDRVVGVSPAPGTQVRSGSTITLTVV